MDDSGSGNEGRMVKGDDTGNGWRRGREEKIERKRGRGLYKLLGFFSVKCCRCLLG